MMGIWKIVSNPLFIGGVISLVALIYYGNYQIQSLREDNVELSVQLAESLERNERTAQQLRQQESDIRESMQEVSRVRSELDRIEKIRREQEDALRSAIGRQDVVWERPILVERMLIRNWQQFTDEISCSTGASERCDNNE